jgi:hypothetical protein
MNRSLSSFRFWLSKQIGDCKRSSVTILDSNKVQKKSEDVYGSIN